MCEVDFADFYKDLSDTESTVKDVELSSEEADKGSVPSTSQSKSDTECDTSNDDGTSDTETDAECEISDHDSDHYSSQSKSDTEFEGE